MSSCAVTLFCLFFIRTDEKSPPELVVLANRNRLQQKIIATFGVNFFSEFPVPFLFDESTPPWVTPSNSSDVQHRATYIYIYMEDMTPSKLAVIIKGSLVANFRYTNFWVA